MEAEPQPETMIGRFPPEREASSLPVPAVPLSIQFVVVVGFLLSTQEKRFVTVCAGLGFKFLRFGGFERSSSGNRK